MRPELVIVNDEVVAVRLSGQEFPCEPETGESIIPKNMLTGFRLSEIPEELTIKPVESIDVIRLKSKTIFGCRALQTGQRPLLLK